MGEKRTSGKLPGRAFPWRALVPWAVSVLMIGICSKNSPLYPMNDWVDVNCFFTVGRGIRHGLLPYLDLYEQKGPLIYFLYALAALISEDSFIGVFLIEAVCFACFLHFSGKIAEALSQAAWAYPLAAAIVGAAVPLTPAFSHGGSAEELMLPFLACGLLIVVEAMAGERRIGRGKGVLLGVLAALAFWSKYTFCGLFAGLALGVALIYIKKRWAGDLLRLIGFFLLGAAIPSALIAGWFAAHGALHALWEAYLVNNLTLYAQNARGGQYDPPLLNLLNNLPWAVPAVLGLLMALFRKERWLHAAALWLGAACLFGFTYLNGRRYPYYALILAVFAPLGIGFVCAWIRERAGKRLRLVKRAAAVLTGLLVAASPFAAFRLGRNVYLLGTAREDMPQYRFAALIRQGEDNSLLNAGFLDGGFYFAAGAQPFTPYFCTLNISLPEMNAAIDRAVQTGETAYIVTRQRLRNAANYRLIDQCGFPYEGRRWTYYLYQRK